MRQQRQPRQDRRKPGKQNRKFKRDGPRQKQGALPPHVIRQKRYLYTENAYKGAKASFDVFKSVDGKECREWVPTRSKLAAAIMKGMRTQCFKEDTVCLYLGASHGYTVSFLSDILKKGVIFAVDFAPRVLRDLLFITMDRTNIIPIYGDAHHPQTYYTKVPQCDVLFMDIAQREQVDIFVKNVLNFVPEGGIAILALKAKSVDTVARSDVTFRKAREHLEKYLTVLEAIDLHPIEKDHMIFVCRR